MFVSFQSSTGKPDAFFLFGVINEVTMIDKKISDKPLQFELSIGMVIVWLYV